jgi:hypothetical protein
MRLSPEEIQTIGPRVVRWEGGPILIPYKALVRVKDSKSIFRLRAGWYKRISAVIVSRAGESVTVLAADLRTGDEVVVSGLGFLRTAEVGSQAGAKVTHC